MPARLRPAEPRVALLQYIVGSFAVHVSLTYEDGTSSLYELATAQDIFPKVDELLSALNGDYPKIYARVVLSAFATDWGQRLLPPAPALANVDILVIIPQHTLHAVPFHLIQYENEAIGCRFGVTYNTSLALLRQCVLRSKTRLSFESETKQYEKARHNCTCVSSDVTGQQNSYFEDIARSFASHFATSKVLSKGGGRIAIKNLTELNERRDCNDDVDVLCVVSHGHVDHRDQDESGLLLEGLPLTGGQPEREVHVDGHRYRFRDYPFSFVPPDFPVSDPNTAELFTIRELKAHSGLPLELVALFGCSTGVGSLSSGDEYNSLAHQWIKAGAVSVVASTWSLNGELLREWSRVFAESWDSKEMPKALAWREANLAISSANPQFEEYAWGVFSLFGDWF